MKKSKNKNIINSFDRVINSAVRRAVNEKSLMFSKDSSFVLGNLVIKKVDTAYVVMDSRMEYTYYKTAFLDNAIYVAHQHQYSRYESIRKLLLLEKSYLKNEVDMTFYLHSYRLLKESGDEEKKNSVEDRYYVAREAKARAKREMKGITRTFSKRINTRKYS